MAMFVVKSIHIEINGQVMDLSIGKIWKESSQSTAQWCWAGIASLSILLTHILRKKWSAAERPVRAGTRDWTGGL